MKFKDYLNELHPVKQEKAFDAAYGELRAAIKMAVSKGGRERGSSGDVHAVDFKDEKKAKDALDFINKNKHNMVKVQLTHVKDIWRIYFNHKAT